MIHELTDLGFEILGISIEKGLLDISQRAAAFDHAVEGTSSADGIGDLVEELSLASDDLDLCGLHGLAKHSGLGCSDVFLNVDLGEFYGLLFFELEFELFVLATSVFQQLHGCGFFGDAIRFCGELQLRYFGINLPLFL